MTRVLRSAVKKNQIKENPSSNLNISNKLKNIKRSAKKKVITKCKENKQSDIWSTNSILSNIFKQTEKSDLINFNTVCKKWNNLTNPIIHKTIKLQRNTAFQNKDHVKNLAKSAKTDAEVEMCIANNSKHAPFINELAYCENLKPQRSIQVFETFKFITNLTIERVSMSQDQFISMIIPLTTLKELNLSNLSIKKIITKEYISEPAVLPPSLTKLTIARIELHKNPELFVQTINSHTNLIEYDFNSNNEVIFLDPFFKNYPSLKIIKYSHINMDHSQPLIKVFESNPQLKTLKLSFSRFSDALMGNISQHLTKLEEFVFGEIGSYHEQTSIISKFTHPTKIKKLSLTWRLLSQCSLNSILSNCPYLEESYLECRSNYQPDISDNSKNPSKLANIKKLSLKCGDLSINLYNSLLMRFAQVKELDIMLPIEWKECMKLIGSLCTDLERLTLNRCYFQSLKETNTFYQEFYETELLASSSIYKTTLKHLVLHEFNIYESKAEYFKNFLKLNCIEYPNQDYINGQGHDTKINFDMGLWPGYRVDIKNDIWNWNGKLIKLSPQDK